MLKGSENMKNTSKVLFLIGGIVMIFGFIAYLLFSIAGFVCGGLAIALNEGQQLPQEIVDVFNKLVAESKMTLLEISASFITIGVTFAVLSLFAIASIVLSFVDKARPNPGLGLLIPSTIIHLCAGNIVSLAGGVVGIVYWSTKGRKEV